MSDSPGLPAILSSLTEGPMLRQMLACAVEEDLGPADGPGDVTTASLPWSHAPCTAQLVTREPGTVCGLAVWPMLMEAYAPRFPGSALTCRMLVRDGDQVAARDVLAELSGEAGFLLALERPFLNLLGRLCGIATRTAGCVQAISGTGAVVCDTRKTTPGLRGLEKYAVACGGGTLHRAGLFDAALYKDNHLALFAPKPIAEGEAPAADDRWVEALAVAIARARTHQLSFVEVEVDGLDQFRALLSLRERGPDMVLLDNFTLSNLREAVRTRDDVRSPVLLEASGGITPATIRPVAECGVDRISIGALTHSVTNLDIGLDMFAGGEDR